MNTDEHMPPEKSEGEPERPNTQLDPDDRKILSYAWFESWICILCTVFLTGSTITSFFRWLPYGYRWDLGGSILSGIMAWACYRWTLSEKPTFWRRYRLVAALGLLVGWSLVFPSIMWGLGFPG